MLPQLEKSVGAKLEGTVTRQIQTQFQTIGRQVLQVIELFFFAVVDMSTSTGSCPVLVVCVFFPLTVVRGLTI